MGISVLQGVPAQAAPAGPGLPKSATEDISDDPVPVPSAGPEPAAPAATAPEVPDYDPATLDGRDYEAVGRAVEEAGRTGLPVEIESQTTETEISFAQPDGTVQVQSSAAPVRTEVDGEWVDVDGTLEFTENGVEPVAVPGEITFSAGGDRRMVRVSDGETATLRLDWDGQLPVPVLEANTATYRDVLPHTDLVLIATRVGFQQHLVVRQRPDQHTLARLRELAFPIAANGADVTIGDGGELVVETDEDVVGTAAAPVMWDARIDPASGEPAALREVGMVLEESTVRGTDATLVLSPDERFLTDASTVYPVTIDPTEGLGPLGDTFVQNNIANTPQGGSTELRVGTWNGGGQVDRSLLRFDANPVFHRVVQSSTLWLWENYSASCTPAWVDVRDAGGFDPSTVTWNTQPWIGGIVSEKNVALGYSSACPANWVGFDLTGWLQHYADARTGMPPTMSLAVTARSETDSLGWKKFSSGNAAVQQVPGVHWTYDGNCDQYYGVYICGGIRAKWHSVGAWNHYLGLPVVSEVCGLTGGGCATHFEGGSIFWSPATGAVIIRGGIKMRWDALGSMGSPLGYPTVDEVCGLAAGGCVSHFERGSIYWSPATGAFDVSAAIRDTWAGLGSQTSWLGYPTSGLLPVANGVRQEFQGGNLVFDNRTNAVTVGAGVLKHPTQFQRVTQARTQLKATAKAPTSGTSYDGVRFQWRDYSLTVADGWTDVDPSTLRQADGSVVSGSLLPVVDESDGKASAVYTWNATTNIPDDGLMQVRACFRMAGGSAERCTGVTQITVDRAGLTGANATSAAGPGTVSLLTGAYAVTGRDAEVGAPHGGLAATRTFASNDPNRAGPLGPGWRLSMGVDEAGADYETLIDRTDTVLLVRSDGTQLPYVRKSTSPVDVNNYVGEGEASTDGSALTLVPEAAGTASSYVLTDLDGDKVTFRRSDGGNGHLDGARFRVEKVEAIRGKAGSTQLSPAITTVTYTPGGNPRLLLAPTDAGAACEAPTPGTQAPGCRALEFVYTATSSGDRLGQDSALGTRGGRPYRWPRHR